MTETFSKVGNGETFVDCPLEQRGVLPSFKRQKLENILIWLS